MTEYLAELFKSLPPQIATILIATLPIGELRASIPIAVSIYKLSPLNAFFWSILGNSIPIIILLIILDPLSKFLRKYLKIFDIFLKWLFSRTRIKHSRKFNRWGALALISLVAIPLPFTGGWTGALAAYVFGIPIKKSLPLILLGIIIAGIIVTLMVSGIKFLL